MVSKIGAREGRTSVGKHREKKNQKEMQEISHTYLSMVFIKKPKDRGYSDLTKFVSFDSLHQCSHPLSPLRLHLRRRWHLHLLPPQFDLVSSRSPSHPVLGAEAALQFSE